MRNAIPVNVLDQSSVLRARVEFERRTKTRARRIYVSSHDEARLTAEHLHLPSNEPDPPFLSMYGMVFYCDADLEPGYVRIETEC